MFLTRIEAILTGRTTREAIKKLAPDGRVIAELTVACGNGTDRFPSMFVKVCLWEKLAEQVLPVIDRKGINVGASGFLQVRQYEGKRGKSQLIELKDARALKVFNRDGELVAEYDDV